MRKFLIALVLAVLLVSAFSSVAYAAGHINVPAVAEKHGFDVSGAEWGEIVSSIAQSYPAAIPLAHGRGPSK